MKQGDKGWGENLSYTFSLHDWSYKLLSSRIKQLRDVEKCLQRWAITCKNSCFTPKRYEQTSIFDVYPLLLLVVQNFFWYSEIPFFDVLWWRHKETTSHRYRWTPNIPGPSPERIPNPLSSQRHQPARGRRCNRQMGWRTRLPVPNKMNEWMIEWMNEWLDSMSCVLRYKSVYNHL